MTVILLIFTMRIPAHRTIRDCNTAYDCTEVADVMIDGEKMINSKKIADRSILELSKLETFG